MEEFIIKKCRACQLQLHKIARICKDLSNDTCSCMFQGLVISKLDYANCLLYGVNKVFLHRLQIVQNSAARVILKMRKYDHISRARQELHWLPIQQRIAFSILTDVYKALHGPAATYITDLILLAQPARLTRSSKNFNIAFPVKVPRNSYGKQAFVYAAPSLWNNLPVSIRSSNSLLDFRKQLNTYFFRLAYNILILPRVLRDIQRDKRYIKIMCYANKDLIFPKRD